MRRRVGRGGDDRIGRQHGMADELGREGDLVGKGRSGEKEKAYGGKEMIFHGVTVSDNCQDAAWLGAIDVARISVP
ncbi:hypothetical protein D3C87_1905960 [compost metagenome]